MLQRIWLVARREFLVTVSSKGFLFGVLVMPLLMGLLILLVPKLLAHRGEQTPVEVMLVDTGAALETALRAELSPAQLAQRRDASRRAALRELDSGTRAMADRAADATPLPARYAVREGQAGASVEAGRRWLTADPGDDQLRRVLVVVAPDALERVPGASGYGSYQLYAMRNLPEDAEGLLHTALRHALIAVRLQGSGVDPELVRAATEVVRPDSILVAADGREQGAQGLNRGLPFIMGILLFVAVMTGGQALMMSTVEEKSSRVVEVLLAAVSPLELMWGKLLGQLAVGLVSLAMYVALGLLALLQFAMLGLIDPLLILWLLAFFLVAYLVFGALMLAVGAAVSQQADAQSLMGPIMILMIVPYALTPIFGRSPDAPFAVIASFVPPVNAFAMLARLASSSPPPAWQVLLSLASGLAGAWLAVWFAAKVFRVGLLMHGKPPTFATLVRWARMS